MAVMQCSLPSFGCVWMWPQDGTTLVLVTVVEHLLRAKCQAGYCIPIILYNPPNNPVKLYYNNVTDENAEALRLIILLKAKEL